VTSGLNSWALTEQSIRDWLGDSSMRVRTPASRSTYGGTMRSFATAIGHKRLAQVTQHDLLAFLSAKPLAPNTRALYITVIGKYFDWAIWKGRTKTSPVAGLQFVLDLRRKNVSDGTWLSKGQVVNLFEKTAVSAKHPERDMVVLGLGFLCGFRRGDIVDMRWGKISGDQAEIVGKGDKPALITFPPELADGLAAWRRVWFERSGAWPAPQQSLMPRTREFCTDFHDPTARVEVMLFDEPAMKNAVAKIVRDAGARIGVPSLAPHDMRRTYCGLLEAEGLPLQDIAALMRHDSIATTQTYLRKNPARRQAQARGFRLGIGGMTA
jgi:integrase